MATTNVQQWNPTAANQETDAEYTADSQRAGGATNPSVFQAELANKLFYQLSTYVAALFAAFAAKGFTTSDSNLPTLTAQCSNFLTTGDNIAVHSSGGGPLVSATQVGPTYGSTPTTAAIQAVTQGASVSNFLFSGIDNIGVPRFSVRADGLVSALSVALTGVLTGITAVFSGLLQAASLYVTGNANVGSLQVAGGAPNGQVLTGNGSTYVPQPLPAAQVLTAVLNNVTGSRNFGGTFQNNTGGPIFVSGYGNTSGSAWGAVTCAVGAGSPSTNVYANQSGATTSGEPIGFSFMVPASYFYRVTTSGSATITLQSWTETALSI